jgi:S1-C subfamily serine protease
VLRANLGVTVAPESVARQLRVEEGAMIQAVSPGSPAEKAGLLPTRRGLGGILAGDVITAVGGKRVARPVDLTTALDGLRAGEETDVSFVRNYGQGDQQSKTVRVKL